MVTADPELKKTPQAPAAVAAGEPVPTHSPEPVQTHSPATEEKLGAGLGVLAGAAVGAVAGPVGIFVGAALGAIVGEAAGAALHERHAATSVEPAKAAAFLSADHEDLAALAARVDKELTEGDRDDVRAVIADLQTRVLAHLDSEERDLLPGYAEAAPEDAQIILSEHAAVRKALAEMDMATDLHLVRANAVGAFMDLLRAHAERENRGLYRWAATPP